MRWKGEKSEKLFQENIKKYEYDERNTTLSDQQENLGKKSESECGDLWWDTWVRLHWKMVK